MQRRLQTPIAAIALVCTGVGGCFDPQTNADEGGSTSHVTDTTHGDPSTTGTSATETWTSTTTSDTTETSTASTTAVEDSETTGDETSDDTAGTCRPGPLGCTGDGLRRIVCEADRMTVTEEPCPEEAPYCEGGLCTGCRENDDCSSLSTACATAVCEDGACVFEPTKAGTACDDDLYCTVEDRCDGDGQCVGVARNCGDGLSCTADSCNEDDGCLSIVTSGCLIDGACYADGAQTADGCGVCAPQRSTSSWTPDASNCRWGEIVQIATGGSISCALQADGRAACWGYGELVGSTNAPERSPARWVREPDDSGELQGVRQLALAEGGHACARLSGGAVVCWGRGGAQTVWTGKLGNGTSNDSILPVYVSGFDPADRQYRASYVCAGYHHTCAIVDDGRVACWGGNNVGQIGNGESNTNHDTPQLVSGIGGTGTLSGVEALTCGSVHNCASLSDGRVVCWGSGWQGQLANGLTGAAAQSTVPAVALASDGVTALRDIELFASQDVTCGNDTQGRLLCWGDDQYGQLPNGTRSGSHPLPVLAVGPDGQTPFLGVTQTCASGENGCAIASGNVYCWGRNLNGQLLDHTGTNGVDVPELLDEVEAPVTAIDCASNHHCALTPSGPVCWGSNGAGQSADSEVNSIVVPTLVAAPL